MKFSSIYILSAILSLAGCTSSTQKENQFSFKNGVNLAHWTDHLFEGRTYGDPLWFDYEDAKWIAAQGLDHIQIRVSGKEISGDNGIINDQRLVILDSAIVWAERESIGVVLALMEFPIFSFDSLSIPEEQKNKQLEDQVLFWRNLASHFSRYGDNLRFNIHGRVGALTDDVNYLNNYNLKVLQAIRETNPDRVIYLPSLSLESLEELQVPVDANIAVSIDYDRLDVFSVQHMGPSVVGENFPTIAFPDTVPDLSPYVADGHWLLPYSGKELSEDVVANDFQKILVWRKSLPVAIEIYLPTWGYYTGWPFNPKSVEDEQSIINYGRTMGNTCDKYNIGWAIYDYNSGMPIRIGDKPSILLGSLNLKKK